MKIFNKNILILLILFLAFSECYAQNAEEYYSEALTEMAKGKFGQSREKLEKALEINQSSVWAQLGLSIIEDVEKHKINRKAAIYAAEASLRVNSKEYLAAIRLYKKAIAINPDFTAAHLSLGATYRINDMHDEAISEFEKVITLRPNDAIAYYAYYNLGLIYYDKEDYKSAIKYCDKANNLKYKSPYLSKLLEALEPFRKGPKKQIDD